MTSFKHARCLGLLRFIFTPKASHQVTSHVTMTSYVTVTSARHLYVIF